MVLPIRDERVGDSSGERAVSCLPVAGRAEPVGGRGSGTVLPGQARRRRPNSGRCPKWEKRRLVNGINDYATEAHYDERSR